MNDLDLLLSVATSHGAQLKQVGQDYWACCPIHQEKTASFQIKPTGKFICHGGCGGGDAIDLHRAITGVDYIQAKKDLDLWDNSRPQPKPRPPKPPREYTSTDRAECYRVARWTLTHFLDCTITYDDIQYRNYQFVFQCLFDNPDPLPWLNDILHEIQTNPDPTVDLDRISNPDPKPDNIIPAGPWFAGLFIEHACRLFPVELAPSQA